MNLLKQLQATTSRSQKEFILSKATCYERRVLETTYNPDKIYGLKFKDDEIDLLTIEEPTSSLFDLLHKLWTRVLTGNTARAVVEEYAEANGDLIKLICNKDLQCGVSATTINKALPGLIPQFKLQLAKEVPITQVKYPCYAQLKYDGVRIAIIWDGSIVSFKTRNGKVVHLPKIAEELSKFWEYKAPVMLDTEVTIKQGKSVDRTKVSGMINSARCGSPIDEDLLVFNIFDALDLLDFQTLKCSEDYPERILRWQAYLGSDYLKQVELTIVDSPKEVISLFEKTLAKGEEGLILKPLNHKYTYKRSKDWVKLKDTKTADLQCTDVIEGTGKYQGMIGALVCEGQVEGKDIVVKVGSGLTDSDRAEHITEFIGHTIEVKYNSLIQDSTTKAWSLFLPRFVRIRFDK